MVMGDMVESAEVVVLGAGPAGYSVALKLAHAGREVVLIDARTSPGGTCLYAGCIPSKALIHASELYHQMACADEFGIRIAGGVRFDWMKWMDFKAGVVQKLADGLSGLLRRAKIQVICGSAHLTSEKTIRVETTQGIVTYRAKEIVLASGSQPAILEGLPFDGDRILSSGDLLNLPTRPEKILVLGAGYIGLELAMALAQTKTAVTLVEARPEILAGWPEAIVAVIKRRLLALHVTLHLSTQLTAVDRRPELLTAHLQTGDRKFSEEAAHLLVCVGRRAALEKLGLENLGVETRNGCVVVDETGRTSVPHVWAAGDVVGGSMLAHKAFYEAGIVADSILGRPQASGAFVPEVIFASPELAKVGWTEAEAKARGYAAAKKEVLWSSLGRAVANCQEEGRAVLVYDEAEKLVLGVQLVGACASELIGEATLALEMGARLEDLADMIHVHPTYSEIFSELSGKY